ncbi:uncharacterized protein LOC129801346 [Phlebotomus papatasi]|uniref:uncharacterized protein LOC129801346 n=1 Tax=Phlebotomus papatasi TaxID=29031 RepID=UPI00248398EB|nr:uncharacterized protein LOC129801346 [Phlebotomus papatasi]
MSSTSSSTCPCFVQNAWKKDLCSNCFKSKDEHTNLSTMKSIKIPPLNGTPPKGIMRPIGGKRKKNKVSFPKELSQVIGFGGDWIDSDTDSDAETLDSPVQSEDHSPVYDDNDHDLQRLTKTNTDFNMNNGNLLGDPEVNIKRSFAALKLGTPQRDSDGKKQTLKISVTPFSASNKVNEIKQLFGSSKMTEKKTDTTNIIIKTTPKKSEDDDTPAIVSVSEKSLLEEISETLEKNEFGKETSNLLQNKKEEANYKSSDLSVRLEIKNSLNKVLGDNKRPISRHVPVAKDQPKPRVPIYAKTTDTDSNSSDVENGISEYYDVVETTTVSSGSYENVPDGEEGVKVTVTEDKKKTSGEVKAHAPSRTSFFSSQFITDMCLSTKPVSQHLKKRSEMYNLSDGSYITGKITSDGLIVTKTSSEDALDSTGSSFDSSSDEEMSSINRSESDSGIVANEYQNVEAESRLDVRTTPTTSSGTTTTPSSTDYEVIEVQGESGRDDVFSVEKSRELAGEPDGSSDPDVNGEAPALPTSPPPNVEPRSLFLHSLQKHLAMEKPKVPSKPAVNVVKTFTKKPQASVAQQQVILQLQSVIKSPEEKATLAKQDSSDPGKVPKKGRAPNPPPSPVSETKKDAARITKMTPKKDIIEPTKIEEPAKSTDCQKVLPMEQSPTLYTRNPSAALKSTSPVVREKDKRERATINPKFRSLNSLNSHNYYNEKQRPSTPEPAPRKSLSLSQDNLLMDKPKKAKFSIRKFLRMGSSKTLEDAGTKRSGIYEELPGTAMQTKPRLVIIHPIDINTSGVEVVKDTSKMGIKDESKNNIVTGKPPAPPQRTVEISKPARPPPPKSAELIRKQQQHLEMNLDKTDSVKQRVDNVYANLGEVRSSMAPRKPERTASMREREAQLELARRRTPRKHQEYPDTASDISSSSISRDTQGTNLSRSVSDASEISADGKTPSKDGKNSESDSVENKAKVKEVTENEHNSEIVQHKSSGQQTLASSASATTHGDTINERKRRLLEIDQHNISSKVEMFERTISDARPKQNLDIKSSVQKMSNTIDNYLKDRMSLSEGNIAENHSIYTTEKHPVKTTVEIRNNDIELRAYEPIMVKQDRVSLPAICSDERTSIYGGSVASYRLSLDTPQKFHPSNSLANLPRTVSMSYCGSEMGESEIYSPYSFCGGSEAGGDVAMGDPQDGWSSQANAKSRQMKTTNRLRMRKGRSVVHKNLEDNYGAVVVANHEALAQVLDQLQQSPPIPIILRPLANSMNLRFDEFSIVEGGRAVVIGRRAFHAAMWAPNQTPVTLALTADCNQMSGVAGELKQLSGAASGALNPITEFCDLVPSNFLPLMPSIQIRLVQASISVLPRMLVDTLMSLGSILKSKVDNQKASRTAFGGSIPNLSTAKDSVQMPVRGSVQNLSVLNEDDTEECELDSIVSALTPNPTGLCNTSDEILCREVGFVMLQLINGLKNLQAKGIEEMPLTLSNVILCKEVDNKEAQARLCVLQSLSSDASRDEDDAMGTLCQCAQVALTQMLPATKLTPILADILSQERSETLSKTKSILEFALWGPSDVTLTGAPRERELALQRWLDLERATVLHGLVRSRVELTVYDECHLMFLVRSNAKIMSEAAALLHNFNKLDPR